MIGGVESNVGEVAGRFNRFGHELHDSALILLDETVGEIKDEMSQEGEPIRYPVQWDSQRQRRAFFATNGFGHGIPYQRTGRYVRAWHQERVAMGTTLSNPHPAGAIGGLPGGWQSRIHRGRWKYLTQVLFDKLAQLTSKVSEMLKVLTGND